MLNIELLKGELPTCVRWHPRKDTVVAVGYKSGRISFLDVGTLQSYNLERYESDMNDEEEKSMLEKGTDILDSLVSEDNGKLLEEISVVDMNWDKGEDHLMVGYENGKAVMILFGGFTEDATKWKFDYER